MKSLTAELQLAGLVSTGGGFRGIYFKKKENIFIITFHINIIIITVIIYT